MQVTGALDNGNPSYPRPSAYQDPGAGECLVDEVEVPRVGESANRVSNGGFESGSQGGVSMEIIARGPSAGAAVGTRCLHLRSEGDGDTGPNTVRTTLSPVLAANQSVTIRARVRWLSGWPEVLFRLHGNYLELPARMTLPTNLGTPGQPNSRALGNTGPAIYEVNHEPGLPRANEAVRVTCRVSGSRRRGFRATPVSCGSVLDFDHTHPE